MEEYVRKSKLHEIVDYHLKTSNGAEHYAYNIIKNEITAMPSEKVHGKWEGSICDFHCSICGVYQNMYTGQTNYCPNCGAYMGDTV